MSRPRVVLLRGHNVNVWDLRPLERLTEAYDLSVLLTGSNVHRVEGLRLPAVRVRSPRHVLPAGRAAAAAAAVPERVRGRPCRPARRAVERGVRRLAAAALVLARGLRHAAYSQRAGTCGPAATPVSRQDAAAMAARADVPVRCWHQIRRATGRDGAAARTYIVSPEALAAQLEALDRAPIRTGSGAARRSRTSTPRATSRPSSSPGRWTAKRRCGVCGGSSCPSSRGASCCATSGGTSGV